MEEGRAPTREAAAHWTAGDADGREGRSRGNEAAARSRGRPGKRRRRRGAAAGRGVPGTLTSPRASSSPVGHAEPPPRVSGGTAGAAGRRPRLARLRDRVPSASGVSHATARAARDALPPGRLRKVPLRPPLSSVHAAGRRRLAATEGPRPREARRGGDTRRRPLRSAWRARPRKQRLLRPTPGPAAGQRRGRGAARSRKGRRDGQRERAGGAHTVPRVFFSPRALLVRLGSAELTGVSTALGRLSPGTVRGCVRACVRERVRARACALLI